jgi:hypothetical protein
LYPYQIQNDVLGESLADFQKNQKCTLQPNDDGIEEAQSCIALGSKFGGSAAVHYAGMQLVSKIGNFYQGRLYSVTVEGGDQEECKAVGLLSILTEKWGEPTLTITKEGREVNVASADEKYPFNIWQNGKETITFTEAGCYLSFWNDEVSSKIEKMESEKWREKEAEKETAKKKDM